MVYSTMNLTAKLNSSVTFLCTVLQFAALTPVIITITTALIKGPALPGTVALHFFKISSTRILVIVTVFR